jgi:tRNA (pseudouridine54-N1)-methyltransferase
MPGFIVLGHRVRTDGDFTLNDLAGSTGRLDVLLRCINSAFMLSNDIRRDVEINLVLLGEPTPPKTVRLNGNELKYLNPDERSTGALIKNALNAEVGPVEEISSPGIRVSRHGLPEVLQRLTGKRIINLREDGEDIRKVELSNDDVFILGGQEDLTPDEEGLLAESDDTVSVSLGAKSLHADHCITIVLNELYR